MCAAIHPGSPVQIENTSSSVSSDSVDAVHGSDRRTGGRSGSEGKGRIEEGEGFDSVAIAI
ncbi:hypothetical protein GYMLUDRAFT_51071 [Collybiopsis luxurians FD-317 M1]|uniref:Uncharacterized protein n=1 Tax=Collybiopsis luxurians FD-317 M1 TaxID=944289 RepID=A0A0D0C7A8_9AGAR|nr:hypothetical protein GYMLUDRAFT_51071 [Collybiopsis luxurians FD-317 M1]